MAFCFGQIILTLFENRVRRVVFLLAWRADTSSWLRLYLIVVEGKPAAVGHQCDRWLIRNAAGTGFEGAALEFALRHGEHGGFALILGCFRDGRSTSAGGEPSRVHVPGQSGFEACVTAAEIPRLVKSTASRPVAETFQGGGDCLPAVATATLPIA